ncbi:unnamed protein product [Rhizophagus irregularis]|nr:unnamed protein product [Rhizophagus irregularis]
MGKNNSKDSTNKNQIQEDTSYDSPDDDYSDSEESRAITIKLSIRIVRRNHEFPDPKYLYDLKMKGLTTRERFVAWWNEHHPDFQITVDSVKKWTYREDENPSNYNVHWSEYGY